MALKLVKTWNGRKYTTAETHTSNPIQKNIEYFLNFGGNCHVNWDICFSWKFHQNIFEIFQGTLKTHELNCLMPTN